MSPDRDWVKVAVSLTARGRRLLEHYNARLDRSARHPEAELVELLRQHQVSPGRAALDAERLLAGLTFDHSPDVPFRIGVCQLLLDGHVPSQHPDDPTGSLLPFAVGRESDALRSVAPDGEVWFHEWICMSEPIREAANARTFIERVARTMIDPAFPIGLRVDAHVGAQLGDALGVPPVPEASDDIERVWEDRHIEIIEDPDWQFLIDPLDPDQEGPRPFTRMRVSNEQTRDRVVAALRQLGRTAQVV
jgi:hypothetical protein